MSDHVRLAVCRGKTFSISLVDFFFPRRQLIYIPRVCRNIGTRIIGVPCRCLPYYIKRSPARPLPSLMYITPSLPRRPPAPKPILLFLLLGGLGVGVVRCLLLREPPKPDPYVARTHTPPTQLRLKLFVPHPTQEGEKRREEADYHRLAQRAGNAASASEACSCGRWDRWKNFDAGSSEARRQCAGEAAPKNSPKLTGEKLDAFANDAVNDAKNAASGSYAPMCCRRQTTTFVHRLADEVLDPLGVPYSLNGGTLLGAVRCGSFLSYDYDLDISVLGLPKTMNEDALWEKVTEWRSSAPDGGGGGGSTALDNNSVLSSRQHGGGRAAEEVPVRQGAKHVGLLEEIFFSSSRQIMWVNVLVDPYPGCG